MTSWFKRGHHAPTGNFEPNNIWEVPDGTVDRSSLEDFADHHPVHEKMIAPLRLKGGEGCCICNAARTSTRWLDVDWLRWIYPERSVWIRGASGWAGVNGHFNISISLMASWDLKVSLTRPSNQFSTILLLTIGGSLSISARLIKRLRGTRGEKYAW